MFNVKYCVSRTVSNCKICVNCNYICLILGLVRSRDGSNLSPSGQPYISLPSPNIQSAKPPPQSSHSQIMEDYISSEIPGPDTSQLVRRGALVPPKMDEEEDYDEEVVCTSVIYHGYVLYTYYIKINIELQLYETMQNCVKTVLYRMGTINAKPICFREYED